MQCFPTLLRKTLANPKVYVYSLQDGIFSITSGISANEAIAVDCYFEDGCSNGNPGTLLPLQNSTECFLTHGVP